MEKYRIPFIQILAGFFSLTLIFQCAPKKHDGAWISIPPAYDQYLTIDTEGKSILPNGRFVTPAGKTFRTAPHPYGLALSPDGNIAVTANSGTNPLSITIIRNVLSENPDIQQVPPGPSTEKGILASVFMGLAIDPDNEKVYVSGGQENKIYIFSTQTGEKLDSINCALKDKNVDYSHGYIGDLVMTKDGSTIYAVDQINFRVAVLSTKTNSLIHSIPVGRYPFGIILSPDEQKVYVANVGMYAYQRIPGLTKENLKEKSLKFPAFGYGTKEAEEGIHNDSIDIPGLGEQNAIESFSVFTIDITDKNNPITISTIDYNNIGYTHQGWFTEDMTYFILGDETDEIGFGNNTRAIVFNFTDLDNPEYHTDYFGPTTAIDHNGYVKGNTYYQANYTAGVRMIDISDIAAGTLTEVGFFDTYPESNSTSFHGAWSVYPYFESGTIIISDIEGGLFVVRKSN